MKHQREIDMFGVVFQNGLVFESPGCFKVKWDMGEGDQDIIVFRDERQFEKLTNKTMDDFDITAFIWIRENYFKNKKVDVNNIDNYYENIYYDFSEWNEPLKLYHVNGDPK